MHRTSGFPSQFPYRTASVQHRFPTQARGRHPVWRHGLALLATLLACLASFTPPADAQGPKDDPATLLVTIPQGEFRQVQMSMKQNITDARSENPKIVRLFTDPGKANVITVKGENPGATKVFLTDEKKNTEVFEVRVTTPGERTPEEKRKDFLELVSRAFPTASVHVAFGPGNTYVIHGDPGGESNTTGPLPQEGITELAARVFGRENIVVNFNRSGVQQVQLEVVVAVVNRSEARNIAFSFVRNTPNSVFSSILQAPLNLTNTLATGPTAANASLSGNPNLIFGLTNAGFTGYLQALRTEGLAKILSEPRITTLSGKAAYINSGGKVPTFATSGLGQATIQYEAFGTTVEFLPIILAGDKIYLEVRPEISDIDESLRVTLGQNTAPGFRTRRAQVAVEIEDGQTLAIGGLIQNTVNASTTKVPILGDFPVIGAAFRNTTFLEREEELIILVTPRLVHPFPCTMLPKYLPGRETRSPDDYELYLEGILEAPRGPREICVGHHTGGYLGAHMNGPTAGVYPCAGNGGACGLGGHRGGCANGSCGTGGGCANGACGLPSGHRVSGTAPAGTPRGLLNALIEPTPLRVSEPGIHSAGSYVPTTPITTAPSRLPMAPAAPVAPSAPVVPVRGEEFEGPGIFIPTEIDPGVGIVPSRGVEPTRLPSGPSAPSGPAVPGIILEDPS